MRWVYGVVALTNLVAFFVGWGSGHFDLDKLTIAMLFVALILSDTARERWRRAAQRR